MHKLNASAAFSFLLFFFCLLIFSNLIASFWRQQRSQAIYLDHYFPDFPWQGLHSGNMIRPNALSCFFKVEIWGALSLFHKIRQQNIGTNERVLLMFHSPYAVHTICCLTTCFQHMYPEWWLELIVLFTTRRLAPFVQKPDKCIQILNGQSLIRAQRFLLTTIPKLSKSNDKGNFPDTKPEPLAKLNSFSHQPHDNFSQTRGRNFCTELLRNLKQSPSLDQTLSPTPCYSHTQQQHCVLSSECSLPCSYVNLPAVFLWGFHKHTLSHSQRLIPRYSEIAKRGNTHFTMENWKARFPVLASLFTALILYPKQNHESSANIAIVNVIANRRDKYKCW